MQVKQLQKEYAGDDAPILYPSSQLIANQENINVNTTNNTHFSNDNRDIMDVKDLHTLVFESYIYYILYMIYPQYIYINPCTNSYVHHFCN